MKANDNIKCGVESCKYQDHECDCCTLDQIEVGCTCDSCSCKHTDETVCRSFEVDDKKIED